MTKKKFSVPGIHIRNIEWKIPSHSRFGGKEITPSSNFC